MGAVHIFPGSCDIRQPFAITIPEMPVGVVKLRQVNTGFDQLNPTGSTQIDVDAVWQIRGSISLNPNL